MTTYIKDRWKTSEVGVVSLNAFGTNDKTICLSSSEGSLRFNFFMNKEQAIELVSALNKEIEDFDDVA